MPHIAAGHRFREVQDTLFGHPPPDWVVEDVFVGTDGKEYAHVYADSKPHEGKTLSTAILRDKRRFIQVQVTPTEP